MHINSFKSHAWLSLWCCSATFAVATASGADMSAISEISLERDCSGCPTGTSLVLRRDGTAILTVLGKARQGTENRVSRGHISKSDFDAIAQLAVARGFFALDDSYDNPEVQDGPWTTTGLVRDGLEKRVFKRDDAGPSALEAIDAAIDALRVRIRFVPDP